MKDKEMIEEIDKQRERRINYCVRIQEAFDYKGNYDHEDIPSILVDFEKEIKNEILPEDSVVLTKEEYEDLRLLEEKYGKPTYIDGYMTAYAHRLETANNLVSKARKETAERILKPLYDACKEDSYGQVVVDFAILENFAKQFGVEIKGK